MDPGQLLAATSYAVDLTLDASRLHGWRVAVLARRMANAIAPEWSSDIFYAGFLHDASSVGFTGPGIVNGHGHVDHESFAIQKSASLLRWLPGMGHAADCLLSMWNPFDCLQVDDAAERERTFTGSQILRLADAADGVGVFNADSGLADKLHLLRAHTGELWTKEVWGVLVELLREPGLYRSLRDTAGLHTAVVRDLQQAELPKELDNEAGVDRVLHIIATLVDLKDPSTSGHSLRTAKYARQLAELIGLPPSECERVYRAGLVHDCGRLGIPSVLLNTSGRLDERGLQTVRKHASMTMRVMSCLPECKDMIELGNIAGHDHERYDGTGYPDGLAGEQIPLLSRILSVCDAYDAMVTPRDYRLLSPRAGVVRLRQGAGTQFDPVIVSAMVNAVDTREITLEAPAAA